jgi:hypothetical protein
VVAPVVPGLFLAAFHGQLLFTVNNRASLQQLPVDGPFSATAATVIIIIRGDYYSR